MGNAVKVSLAAAILAVGMILSSVLVSKLFVRIKHEEQIEVKGYAERTVRSDVGKFFCSVVTRNAALGDAYDDLARDREVVLDSLRTQKIADDELRLENVGITKVYRRDERGNRTNQVELYEVRQGFRITSMDVEKVRDVSRGITDLVREGIDITSAPPQFLVSSLEDIKIDLIAEATRDGHQRALAMAENSGGAVGPLSSARQGVFQITAPNSTETSGYGVYDTSTIEKSVKAVVTLEYAIQ